MTRAEDAREAVALGARYVGVILASGPRRLTIEAAARVLADVPAPVGRVAVFADDRADSIAPIAQRLGLRAVQLHGVFQAARIDELRRLFAGEVWSVLRLASGSLPDFAPEMFDASDAVLLDAHVPGKPGGTGVALPWRELSHTLRAVRPHARARLILAGGLRPENVGRAIRLLRPDIVDVSSGVELAPGIKDHARMRAFRDAVHAST